jgi:hypothetical protein
MVDPPGARAVFAVVVVEVAVGTADLVEALVARGAW